METTNSPLDSFASDLEFPSLDGDKNVEVSSDNGLTLEEINSLTGRDYKDKATALKAIKDTYSMVGKAGKVVSDNQKLKEQLQEKDSKLEEIRQIKDTLFYSENPQYKPFKDTISAMGNDPARVVELDAFKKIFTDLSEYEKTKKAKSVLESNPRIGQAKTKLEEAKDLNSKGLHSNATDVAVAAVLEAYDMQ